MSAGGRPVRNDMVDSSDLQVLTNPIHDTINHVRNFGICIWDVYKEALA